MSTYGLENVIAIPSFNSTQLLSAFLETTEKTILPILNKGVTYGERLFGAAILSRASLQLLTATGNTHHLSPLHHAETNCIEKYFTVDFPDPATRPIPKTETIFYATHEPCSLCLSGLAWAGFSEVYYLFNFEENRIRFNMSIDIKMMQQVFQVSTYHHDNKYFKATYLPDMLKGISDESQRREYEAEVERIKSMFKPKVADP